MQRRIVVETNIRGRDLGGRYRGSTGCGPGGHTPPGYELIWGGQYEHLQEAGKRLAMVVPVTLMLILGTLSVIFGTLRPASPIFPNVPLFRQAASWRCGCGDCRSASQPLSGSSSVRHCRPSRGSS